MKRRHVLVALSVAAVLAGASAGTAREAAAPAGSGVVFSVFEELPPSGACPGLYAVDARTREISWLGGLDARRGDSALYPMFTARGSFSFGHWVDTSSSVPLVDVYAGTRIVARAYAATGWAWSPRREEVAFSRVAQGGRRLELVLGSVAGGARWPNERARALVARTEAGSSTAGWTARLRSSPSCAATGAVAGSCARDASMPLVSPDGRRVAFLRSSNAGTRSEIWIVGISGGAARKVLGRAPAERLRPAVWLSNRELLVQHGGAGNTIFDAHDTLNRVDVDTRRERPFLKQAFALSLSPDRGHVLFVRPHSARGETYYSIRTCAGTDATSSFWRSPTRKT